MNKFDKPDTTPWNEKTPEQRAKCVTDHLAHEFASGNLRARQERDDNAQVIKGRIKDARIQLVVRKAKLQTSLSKS